MLGWQIIISKKIPDSLALPAKEDNLTSWTTGIGGTDWLDEMVQAETAVEQGGNGYPYLYSVTVEDLVAKVSGKVVNFNETTVIGDDYVFEAGIVGGEAVDLKWLARLFPLQELLIEVWDLS